MPLNLTSLFIRNSLLTFMWLSMYLRCNHGTVIRSLLVSCHSTPSMTFVNIAWLSQTPVSCLSHSDIEKQPGYKSITHYFNKVTEHHAVHVTMMQQSPIQSHVRPLRKLSLLVLWKRYIPKMSYSLRVKCGLSPFTSTNYPISILVVVTKPAAKPIAS